MGMLRNLAIGAASLVAFASSANAAQSLVITGPSGTFGDDEVTCASGVAAPCSFTRTFTFATPATYNSATLDISSILNGPGTDINFTSVLFNGAAFTTLATGVQEVRNILLQPLSQGGTNTINVNGTTSGNASFTGNIALSTAPAVPEPSTWAMMLLGFGAMGYSLRRRRSGSLLTQAA